MKRRCTECETINELPTFLWLLHTRNNVPFLCRNCEADIVQHSKDYPMKTANQKLSQAQEKRAAKSYGGKVQPASGALPGAKGDVRGHGDFLCECKTTRNKSYTLKLSELRKLEFEAGSLAGEDPLFEIEFIDGAKRHTYVVMPKWVCQKYREESCQSS